VSNLVCDGEGCNVIEKEPYHVIYYDVNGTRYDQRFCGGCWGWDTEAGNLLSGVGMRIVVGLQDIIAAVDGIPTDLEPTVAECLRTC